MKQLTDEEYVAKSGYSCPFCGSDQITGDAWETTGQAATQEVSCNDCNKAWYDVYELVGYEDAT